MNDLIETDAAQQVVEALPMRHVAADKGETPVQGLQGAEVPLLEGGVVKWIQVIQRPDGMTLLQQSLADMRSDKSRAARHQKIHGATLTKERCP